MLCRVIGEEVQRAERLELLGTSPPPMAEDDPAWIIAPARASPTVSANCQGDFAAIFMIWGFVEQGVRG